MVGHQAQPAAATSSTCRAACGATAPREMLARNWHRQRSVWYGVAGLVGYAFCHQIHALHSTCVVLVLEADELSATSTNEIKDEEAAREAVEHN